MFKFFTNKIQSLFRKKPSLDLLEEAESLFYEGDFGSELTEELCQRLRKCRNFQEDSLKSIITSLLEDTIHLVSCEASMPVQAPHVTVLVGTNGTGKTTTVAKLAHYYQSKGEKVLITATDTFRSAGIDQMQLWAEQLNCGFVAGKPRSDAAAIAYDGITAAISRQYDRVLIDTSGRLHTSVNLLKELSKLVSVCAKAHSGSPHDIFMIVDATQGGNVVDQVCAFQKVVPITGIILTKTDGSAKGGTLFRLAKQLQLPTKFIGYGESVSDLEEFDFNHFIQRFLHE